MNRQTIGYALWMLFSFGVLLSVYGIYFVLIVGSFVGGALLMPVGIVLVVFSLLMIRSEKSH